MFSSFLITRSFVAMHTHKIAAWDACTRSLDSIIPEIHPQLESDIPCLVRHVAQSIQWDLNGLDLSWLMDIAGDTGKIPFLHSWQSLISESLSFNLH